MEKNIFLWLFLLINFLPAQDREDTKKLAFVFKLDNRFSFAEAQMISIHGFRTGIRLKGKHEFGVALNWLGSKNEYQVPQPNNSNNNLIQNYKGRLFYQYVGIFYERIVYKKNRWTLSCPIQFGGGKAGINVLDIGTNNFIERREASFSLIEPSFNADYKIWRYVGIGTGVGYRFAFSKQPIIQDNLTRPVFILKLKIYVMEFFKKRKNEENNK